MLIARTALGSLSELQLAAKDPLKLPGKNVAVQHH